jgi:tetratricopeptide (TPR) repeat protein
VNYFFSEEELAINASLDAWDLLVKMGFTEQSLYREGNTIRLFCPLHKDQIRRSMIIYTDKNTFKCQYTNCEGHKGGNLLEFYSLYMGVDLPDVLNKIRNQGATETDLVDRADKMIQEGQLVDALPLLQKAVQLDSNNEITRCRLAALYLELGDKENGYKEYMTAAEHYGVKGELDKTLQIYNILVIISPDDVKVRKQLSYLFSRLKREDEAVAQLKWVVDKHIRKGELKDAEGICKKMIELSPEYPESHRTLGEVYLKQGNYFDAIEELRTATTHFIRQNNLRKAKETVEQGLKYTPGNPAMKDLRNKIDHAIELQKQAGEKRDEREQEFENWLKDLKTSVGLSEPAALESSGSAGPSPVKSPAGTGAGNGAGASGTGVRPGLGSVARPAAGGGLGRAAGGLGRPAGGLGPPPPGSLSGSSVRPAAGGLGQKPPPPADVESPTEPKFPSFAPPASAPALPKSAPPKSAPAKPVIPMGEPTSSSATFPAASSSRGSGVMPSPGSSSRRLPPSPSVLPKIAADDPRIELCKQNLKDYSDEQLESLHSHLITMFFEVQAGTQEGIMSEFEANVVREFYAAFSLALDSYKSESGKFKTKGGV